MWRMNTCICCGAAISDDSKVCPLCEDTEAGRAIIAAQAKETIKAVVDIGAHIPDRAHKGDAGLDLRAMRGGWILPLCRRAFDTGVHIAVPDGYVGLLTSKSGLMAQGITSRGTIDYGYTGAIKVVLFNHGFKPVKIATGQKISQLVLLPIITPEVELVDRLEVEHG